MAADPGAYVTAFVTLIVVIDPIALAPLFAALTGGESSAGRRRIALHACLIAALVLTVFGLFGEAVLAVVGTSMPAFRIAGGILLFLTALDMLFERRKQRRENQGQAQDPQNDPSAFPLAVPLIAGPGAIATMILLTGQADGGWEWVLAVHVVMLGVILLTFISFLLASPLERLLGPVAINVVTRILGLLLAALSVQFVLDGLSAFGLGHP